MDYTGSSVGLKAVEKRKIPPLPVIESRFPARLAPILVTTLTEFQQIFVHI